MGTYIYLSSMIKSPEAKLLKGQTKHDARGILGKQQ
jgi:hypothetical protein